MKRVPHQYVCQECNARLADVGESYRHQHDTQHYSYRAEYPLPEEEKSIPKDHPNK